MEIFCLQRRKRGFLETFLKWGFGVPRGSLTLGALRGGHGSLFTLKRGLGLAAGYLKGLQSSLTANELKRKLARLGCTFEQGSKHTKVFFRGRVSLIPRHPAVEIKTGTLRGILKQLGIPKL